MNDDPLDLVSALAPTTTPDDRVLTRVRSTLMDTIDKSEPTTNGDTISLEGDRRNRPNRLKRRRVLPLAAIAVVLAAATGTAWAVTHRGSAAQTDNLSCPVPNDPNANAVVDVVTGDPIVDCANQWKSETDLPVPKMNAYDNGHGGVEVKLASDPVPPGATTLPRGVYQNADIRRLENRIADVGDGIDAGCYDTAAAKKMVEGYFDDLGMKGWQVRVDDTPPKSSRGNCALAMADPTTGTVTVRSGRSPHDTHSVFKPFADGVHARLGEQCLNTTDAQAAIQDLAKETTVQNGPTTVHLGEQGMIRFQLATDPTAKCTTATVTVGGAVSVTLNGPAR